MGSREDHPRTYPRLVEKEAIPCKMEGLLFITWWMGSSWGSPCIELISWVSKSIQQYKNPPPGQNFSMSSSSYYHHQQTPPFSFTHSIINNTTDSVQVYANNNELHWDTTFMLCLVYCFLVLRHRLSVISVAEQCPARPSVVWTYC